jgi:uncharacterized NAD(P)/FAD-binding protein YdhS
MLPLLLNLEASRFPGTHFCRAAFTDSTSARFLSKRSTRGISRQIDTEIVDLEPSGEQLLLISGAGEKLLASKVVLALGNFGPGDPPTKDRSFHRSRRYLNMPWSPAMLEQLSGQDDVVIL